MDKFGKINEQTPKEWKEKFAADKSEVKPVEANINGEVPHEEGTELLKKKKKKVKVVEVEEVVEEEVVEEEKPKKKKKKAKVENGDDS